MISLRATPAPSISSQTVQGLMRSRDRGVGQPLGVYAQSQSALSVFSQKRTLVKERILLDPPDEQSVITYRFLLW